MKYIENFSELSTLSGTVVASVTTLTMLEVIEYGSFACKFGL